MLASGEYWNIYSSLLDRYIKFISLFVFNASYDDAFSVGNIHCGASHLLFPTVSLADRMKVLKRNKYVTQQTKTTELN